MLRGIEESLPVIEGELADSGVTFNVMLMPVMGAAMVKRSGAVVGSAVIFLVPPGFLRFIDGLAFTPLPALSHRFRVRAGHVVVLDPRSGRSHLSE